MRREGEVVEEEAEEKEEEEEEEEEEQEEEEHTLTLIEGQDKFPDLRLLPALPVQTLHLQSKRLHKLQTLVDQDGNPSCGRLLLSKRNA